MNPDIRAVINSLPKLVLTMTVSLCYSYGVGGLARGRNINRPKRPEDGLVFKSKMELKNPLSPKRESAINVAEGGTVEFPCTKDFQRVALSGRTHTQYTAG
jgi:hypothetical protein